MNFNIKNNRQSFNEGSRMVKHCQLGIGSRIFLRHLKTFKDMKYEACEGAINK